MINHTEIMDRAIDCLIRELGVVETEYFITFIKNGRFDYTKWREDKFEDMTLHELGEAAAEYERKHPFTGNAKRI